MKKVFMFMLLAAMTMVANAQNPGLKTFDCKRIVSYLFYIKFAKKKESLE